MMDVEEFDLVGAVNVIQCVEAIYREMGHITKIHAPELTVRTQVVAFYQTTPEDTERTKKIRKARRAAKVYALSRQKVVILIQEYGITVEATWV